MQVYAIVGGVEYDLTDGIARFHGEVGLGQFPLQRFEESGPLQDGATDRGYKPLARRVTYVFDLIGADPADLWNRRRQLLRIFRPRPQIVMKHVLPNGDVRYLDVFYQSDMDMPSSDRLHRHQRVAVKVKAPDPMLYDPESVALTFDLGGGGGGWVFPWKIPWTVGASVLDVVRAVEYQGDVGTFPTLFRITGPITDALIVNEATGEALDFDGVTIDSGDYRDIVVQYGYKTVLDKDGVDKSDELTTGSDLATWHIAADDEVPGGVNPIRVSGTAVTEETKVEITYFNRYSGI